MPFNVGERVRFLGEDDFIPNGTLGTVERVDERGTIFVAFEIRMSLLGCVPYELEHVEDIMFEIGDRVIAVRDVDFLEGSTGWIGTVRGYFEGDYSSSIAVEFDNPFPEGHSCSRMCDPSRGRWANVREFELTDKVRKTSRKKKGFAMFIQKVEEYV